MAARQRLNGRYGDAAAFYRAFAPEKTEAFAACPERCVAGEAPALVDVALAYGDTALQGWLMAQLASLAAYCGDREGLTADQCYQCATAIQTHYFYLKITDFMLYFSRLRAGRYGCFYGHIDPMRIVGWLQKYVEERDRIFARAEAMGRGGSQADGDSGKYGPPMNRDEYERWKRDNPEIYEAYMKDIRAKAEAQERRRRQRAAR